MILLIIDLKSNCLLRASQEVFCKRTDFFVLLVAELSNLRFRVQEEPTTLYDETHRRFCTMEQDFFRNFFFVSTLHCFLHFPLACLNESCSFEFDLKDFFCPIQVQGVVLGSLKPKNHSDNYPKP